MDDFRKRRIESTYARKERSARVEKNEETGEKKMQKEATPLTKKQKEWLALVREGSQSLLTDAQWCRENQIAISSFKGWKCHFQREGLLADPEQEIPLATHPTTGTAIFALLPMRPDIRLMLRPLGQGKSPRALLSRAWSLGAECGDGNTYVFADLRRRQLSLLFWERRQIRSTTIELEAGSRLPWPKVAESGEAILKRKDLRNLQRLLLPQSKPPGKTAVMAGKKQA